MNRYKDQTASIEDRINDLLGRMTLKEKIMQTDQYYSADFTEQDSTDAVTRVDMDKLDGFLGGMSTGSVQIRGTTPEQANEIQRYAVNRTRLGIPFLFSEEALHGVNNSKATCFPQQIGLAASFDPNLGRQMGHAIASEARALGICETYSPVMDLIRDPRYGRGEESYGEDTYLCSEFARETVRGMQGSDLKADDAIAAEPKHYVGYGNPVGGLNCAPSTMGRHDVFSDCLPVFEAAIKDGGAVDVMCAYNSIDSIPVSMDHELLTDVLRGQYGMRGFVRTDLTAVSRLYDWHFIAPTHKEAVRLGMEAGVDLQLYDFPHEVWQNSIKELIENGEMDGSVLDEACRRILRVKFMLGLFEHPYIENTGLADERLRCEKHLDLAEKIARESICLLKNDGLLPLSQDVKTIAVLGPCAANAVLGDYTANKGRTGTVSVLDGVRDLVSNNTRVLYERGCNILGDEIHPFDPSMLFSEDGQAGLTGRYYNGREMSDNPVEVRIDHSINFNWIYNKPLTELDANCFSVVWTGYVVMPETMSGCIGLSSHDSMRLYVDGKCLIDGWGSDKNADQMIDFVFEGGKKYAVRVEFTNDQRGARIIFGYSHGREDFAPAVEAAGEADVAIVCVGDNEETSGENFDRTDLNLPGSQLEFVKAVYETGTPVVLVMQTGRPVTANWEQEHIPAIMEAWFPGEQGGKAIAETIFGLNEPGGRLPITFPRSVGQIPCHYSRRPGGGQRYVEMTWQPLYPFGYGMGYTCFEYSDLKMKSDVIMPGDTAKVSFCAKNIGNRKGIAVPQIYIRDLFSSVVKPVRQLGTFRRIELEKGEVREVELDIEPRVLRTLGPDYVWRVEPGDFEVQLGENAESILMTAKLTVTGDNVI